MQLQFSTSVSFKKERWDAGVGVVNLYTAGYEEECTEAQSPFLPKHSSEFQEHYGLYQSKGGDGI